jgi:hypothetical protein
MQQQIFKENPSRKRAYSNDHVSDG